MARLSEELADVPLTAWSGHGVEVIQVACMAEQWPRIVEAARRHLRLQRSFPSAEGGLLVAEVTVSPEDSISRTLEAHHCLWLQPLVLTGGWEHYEAIAYGPKGSEQKALDALSRHGPRRVLERRDVGPKELAESLFYPMRPVLQAPTDKQLEALVAAGDQGYYASPRAVTTGEVARTLGLGRSAFEERLRGGENRIFAALLPLLKDRP